MNLIKNILFYLIVLAFLSFPLFAQDAPPSAPTGGLSAGIGTEVLGGTTYQTFSLIPDVGLGPAGVGLDLSIHYRFYEKAGGDFGFYPRAEDWWDNALSLGQNIDKYTSRIVYFRWGKKGEPLYVQAGLLPNISLGNGFLVGGYNNGALRPKFNYTGFTFDIDGKLFNFPLIGVESFVNNITSFDVVGLRLYSRPFGILLPEEKFFKDMQFGVSFALDRDPYIQATSSTSTSRVPTAPVTVFGIDTRLPLTSSPLFSAAAMADVGFEGSNVGGSLGLGGGMLAVMNWGMQCRFLGDNFIPAYFDRGYEINRASKLQIYKGATKVPGIVGWQISLGAGLLDGKVAFGSSLEGPFTSTGGNAANNPKLRSFATLKEGLLPVSLDAFYNKDNITDFATLFSPKDALIGAKLGYKVGSVTISMVYDVKYIAADDPVRLTNPGKDWVTTSRLETAVKLF